MRTSISQYAQALLELSSNKTEAEQGKIVENLIAFLRRKGESEKLPRILEKIRKLEDERSGVTRVSVTTAFPLGEGSQRKIEAFAKKVFGGESVVLDKSVDPKVLGGFVLRTDDRMLDVSLSKKMKYLRNVLTQ